MSTSTLPVLSYDANRDSLAIPADAWDALGMRNVRPHVGDLLAKSLQDKGFLSPMPFVFPFDGSLHKAVVTTPQAKPLPSQGSKGAPPKGGSEYRWITVHPHGEEHGVPIRIKANNDGSYSVVGGGGGKLNGLRLTDVKSPEEYKHIAAEKAKERKEKANEENAHKWDGLKDKHREGVLKEAAERGEDVSDSSKYEDEVISRAGKERAEKEGLRAQSESEVKDVKRDQEKALIEHVAKVQGWKPDEYLLPDEATAELARQKKAEILSDNPDLKEKLESGDAKVAERAAARLNGMAEKVIEKVRAKTHDLALKRAREVLDNARELVVSATDGISKENMGDVETGDLVKHTLGDSGKGYATNLREEAEARGMILPDTRREAQDANFASRVERKDGDVGKALLAESFIEKLQAGAAMARAEVKQAVESLGKVGAGPLGKIQNLDTSPKVEDVKSAVDLLAGAKKLEAQIKETKGALKDVKGGDELETLPKAALIQSSGEMSHEDAVKEVMHDLEERERQRAMDSLVDAYNAQDAISPLQSHRLSGHNAFLNGVAHAASLNGVGVRGLDPLQADILGAAGSAAVLRRALDMAAGDDKAKLGAVKEALAAHHVEKQVAHADAAVERAGELLNQADNLEQFDIDSMDGLMAGLDQEKARNELVREAREHLGVALGRLEAGAAMNEAFMGSKKGDVQIPLGALGMQDAMIRAKALGLGDTDSFDEDGTLIQEGHFGIFNDGKNKILVVHPQGLDHLASQLQEDPDHIERLQKVADIKAGKSDEANWLPDGFSHRPSIDVSGGDGLQIPQHELQLDLRGADGAKDIAARLRSHIASRIEAGHDPVAIVSGIRSELFRQEHVPGDKQNSYSEALDAVAPPFRKAGGGAAEGNEMLAHQEKLRAMFGGYHGDWVKGEVAAGRMTGEEASLHKQTLPQDPKTHDLVHQVALQDPRLMHAFHDVGALGPEGRKAIRAYAFDHLFRDHNGNAVDSKDREVPTQALSEPERKAFEAWKKLDQNGKGDPYAAIQKHLKAHSEESSGGGLFGDDEPSEPHAFSTLDLNDDAGVVAVAKEHADELGYNFRRDIGSDARSFPELETSDGRSEKDIASGARKRIQSQLRRHAFEHMFGAPELLVGDKAFDPARVQTGSKRWAQYVAGMGGGDAESEKRAYQTVQEKMKGDFAARFAKGFGQLHGREFQTAPVPLTYGDAHSVAVLDPDKRKEVEAKNASERAKMQNRAGGKFGEDDTGAKLDAARQQSLLDASLFGTAHSKTDSQKLDTHRLGLGGAAEAMVRGLMPNIKLKKGTAAAGDINMSSGVGVKRQRAIKQIEVAKRIGLTLGVGTGKTAISLGAFSHLKKQGKVARAIMAVPSVVQEQFGSEAARFYDLTDKDHPKWCADSALSPGERRASYHKDSGHNICVVTHQALRDDLNWAVAGHKFGGDETASAKFLEEAPETERNTAMKEAMAHHGWDFDMSVVDEGHNLLNRAGKANSAMANTLDAMTSGRDYHVSMSADPVKNDASEGFDFLRKVSPERYVNDDALVHQWFGGKGFSSDHAQQILGHVASMPSSVRRFLDESKESVRRAKPGELPAFAAAANRRLVNQTTGESKSNGTLLGAQSPERHTLGHELVHAAWPQIPRAKRDELCARERARGGALADVVLSSNSLPGVSPEEHQQARDVLQGALQALKEGKLTRESLESTVLDHSSPFRAMAGAQEKAPRTEDVSHGPFLSALSALAHKNGLTLPGAYHDEELVSYRAQHDDALLDEVMNAVPSSGKKVKSAGVVSRSEFLRRYAVNTPASMEALQNEMAPYHYAESITPESELSHSFHSVPMTAPQQTSYNQVQTMYQRARQARRRGQVDVEAVKHLSPNSFADVPETEHEETAKRLAGSLGILRDSALDRVVNQHPQGAKIEWLDERLGLAPKSGKYGDFDPKSAKEHCPIVFAHNLGSIDLLEKHLKSKGLRVARLDGTMSGEEKERAKTGFSPQFDKASGKYVSDPTADVMLCSDAGAVGWNGQRSRHVVHFDTPHTAMVHEQRTGRSYRTGQEHDVHADTVLTDTAYEKTRRKRLERKGAMRDALTSPAEMLDDSGLAHRIARQADAARAKVVKDAVNQAELPQAA